MWFHDTYDAVQTRKLERREAEFRSFRRRALRAWKREEARRPNRERWSRVQENLILVLWVTLGLVGLCFFLWFAAASLPPLVLEVAIGVVLGGLVLRIL
jgi:hypothetical protein